MWGGVILAGGPNRRMGGEPKGLLRLGNETLIERQVREMRKVCSEIIVVTDDPSPYLRLLDRDVRIITDYYKKNGPLTGIHAGLMLSTLQPIWVIGCDMPFIDAKAALILRNALRPGKQAAIPSVNGLICPLHGVYDRSCAEAARELLEQGETSVSALLQKAAWAEVSEEAFVKAGVPLQFIWNINTAEDYERLLQANL